MGAPTATERCMGPVLLQTVRPAARSGRRARRGPSGGREHGAGSAEHHGLSERLLSWPPGDDHGRGPGGQRPRGGRERLGRDAPPAQPAAGITTARRAALGRRAARSHGTSEPAPVLGARKDGERRRGSAGARAGGPAGGSRRVSGAGGHGTSTASGPGRHAPGQSPRLGATSRATSADVTEGASSWRSHTRVVAARSQGADARRERAQASSRRSKGEDRASGRGAPGAREPPRRWTSTWTSRRRGAP